MEWISFRGQGLQGFRGGSVEATRARRGTDWYIAREQLGEEGQDSGRIARFAELMRGSRRQVPSVQYRGASEQRDLFLASSRDPFQLDRLNPLRALARTLVRNEPGRDAGRSR